MKEKDMERLKSVLMKQRRELFAQLQGLESDWEKLGERDIEMEEEAQKAHLTELFSQLDEMEIKELKEIDAALIKVNTAAYGICETCSKPVSPERLEALPATPFCKRCAREAEKAASSTRRLNSSETQ